MPDSLTIPDSLFPSDNVLEIPSLRLDMQATTCDIPFVCFGEQRRTYEMGGSGTLHFYTDDYRFTSIYDHPEKILHHHPRNIVEPNYSLFNDTPVAFGLQAIYKKRTLARTMQEQGLRVFVDLNVANKFYAYNLIGVPMGWASFCTRGYSDRLNALEFEYLMARRISNGNPLTFVVYGGGSTIQDWCRDHKAVYVTPLVRFKDKIKALERMSANAHTALFAPSVNLGNTLPQLTDLLSGQVANYNQPSKIN